MESFEKIKTLVAEMEGNVTDLDGGKKYASTNVRKDAQALKNLAQELRKEALEARVSLTKAKKK